MREIDFWKYLRIYLRDPAQQSQTVPNIVNLMFDTVVEQTILQLYLTFVSITF